MKTILIDVGSFYTKACVMRRLPVGNGDTGEAGYRFFGRSFFPTAARRANEVERDRIHYEHDGQLYAVGYDGTRSLRLEELGGAFGDETFDQAQALVLLKKVVFDFADAHEDLDVHVVVDSYQKAQVFEQVARALGSGAVEIAAFRGYDQRRIKKDVAIAVSVMSSGDAITGFLDRSGIEFETALVMDVGHHRTKLYVVGGEEGVELFRSARCGVSFYYEKILHLLAEERVADHHYLWLVKQIELGCDEIEIRRERRGDAGVGGDAAATASDAHHFDVSLVMDNVRWDLNKEFTRFTTDTLTSYFTNRVEWPGVFVVMGGGAALNGDMLRLSLEEGGFCFDGAYVEKQPMYAVLDGAAYALGAETD